jgi:hypothetical protein
LSRPGETSGAPVVVVVDVALAFPKGVGGAAGWPFVSVPAAVPAPVELPFVVAAGLGPVTSIGAAAVEVAPEVVAGVALVPRAALVVASLFGGFVASVAAALGAFPGLAFGRSFGTTVADVVFVVLTQSFR